MKNDIERKGVLTPDQEKQLDELIELKGALELFDGTAIRLADNLGIEALKVKIPAEYLPLVYEIIDEIFKAIPKVKA